ncbi:MAG: TonB-dependent receptor [Polyangiaceae bacterium]
MRTRKLPSSSRRTHTPSAPGGSPIANVRLRRTVSFGVLAALALTPAAAAAQDEGSGAVPSGSSGAVVKPAKDDPKAAKKPKLVPPKLVKFASAPYPEEAQKKGIQADVILELTIDKDGKVTDAKTVEPVGNGFDEAAEAAALEFVFEPATKDGKPIPAKIRYKYSFTLTPAEPDKPGPDAPPKKPDLPTTGNIGGSLRIAGTKGPLAGAQILITSNAGIQTGTTSDGQGKWKIEGLPPGKYDVEISSPGFTTGKFPFEIEPGKEYEFDYALPPEVEGEEVTVQGVRPPREVTRRTVERREINRIPGTSGDALRSLQSLPGVARPPGLAGLLIVRGSAPQDTATFVDGSEVPLIYHFGGLSSVVPTELLDRIDFYPGNFSARYGRVMGGIVDVALREPDISCTGPYGKASDKKGCYHGMAQVDLIDARVMAQGPLGPLKGWSFAAAGRRSWFDVWLKPVLEEAGAGVTSAPVYDDYQFIVDNKPDANSRLSMRFYGSHDELEILIKDPAAQDPAFGGNLSFSTSFWRAQMLYETKLSKDLELNTMFSVGETNLAFSVSSFLFDLNLVPIETRSEFGWTLTKGAKLNVGTDIQIVPFEVVVRAPQPPRPGEPDPGPFVTKPPLEQRQKGTGYRPAYYAEAEVTPTPRLRVVPGVRLDFARDSGHSDLAPRFNARYDIVNPTLDGDEDAGKLALRTTVKGGVGVYRQPPQFQETDDVFGTPGLESNQAIHYSVGVEQEFSRHIELGVEGFYKDLTNLVSRQASDGGGFDYGNAGTGYTMGLETLLKYKPDKHFFGWVAYTLSRSVRQDSPDSEEYLFQYDQTHNLTMLGSYRLGRGWEFGARFRVISGSLDTPALSEPALTALYAADAGAYTPIQAAPFSERLPLFHQLDIRVDKRWQFEDWKLSAYLDVQNVYNNAAREAILYNYNFSRRSYQQGLPLIPSVGMRGEF